MKMSLLTCVESKADLVALKDFLKSRNESLSEATMHTICFDDELKSEIDSLGWHVYEHREDPMDPVRKMADKMAVGLSRSWYQDPATLSILTLDCFNLGECLHKTLSYYFVGVLQRIVTIQEIWVRVKPEKVFLINCDTPSTADDSLSGGECSMILKLEALRWGVGVEWVPAMAGIQKAHSEKRQHVQSFHLMGKKALSASLRRMFNQVVRVLSSSTAPAVGVSAHLIHVDVVMKKLGISNGTRLCYTRPEFGPRLLPRLWQLKAAYDLPSDEGAVSDEWRLSSIDRRKLLSEAGKTLSFCDVPLQSFLKMKLEAFLCVGYFERCGQMYRRGRSWIRRRGIKALLMDEDVCEFNKTLAMAARAEKVYSAVIQHGVPMVSVGFSPFTADEMFVWGGHSRDVFESWGIPSHRMKLTGAPRYSQETTMSPPKYALLATQPYHGVERADFISSGYNKKIQQDILELLSKVSLDHPSVPWVIKLHPRDRQRKGLEESLRLKSITPDKVKILQSGSSLDYIRQAFFVVCPWSSVWVEALCAGKRVLLVDLSGLGGKLLSYQTKSFCIAQTIREAARVVESWIAGGNVSEGDVLKENKSVIQYVYEYGDRHASDRIAQKLMEAVS